MWGQVSNTLPSNEQCISPHINLLVHSIKAFSHFGVAMQHQLMKVKLGSQISAYRCGYPATTTWLAVTHAPSGSMRHVTGWQAKLWHQMKQWTTTAPSAGRSETCTLGCQRFNRLRMPPEQQSLALQKPHSSSSPWRFKSEPQRPSP